jgi:membrane protein DedA with SNARE-associated domain
VEEGFHDTTSPGPPPARSWPLVVAALAALVLFVLAAAIVVSTEGWTDSVRDVSTVARSLVDRYAVPVTVANLYVEDSGLPVPMASDFLVANLGRQFAGNLGMLFLLWVTLIAVVVAGSSNLYWVTRRWGPSIARSRYGVLLRLTPERLERGERWFRRWGPLAILVGRHVIGLHVPLTAAAGTLRMPYPRFALSVALSTAPWAAILLWLGIKFGGRVGQLVSGHPWTVLLLPAGILALVLLSVVEMIVRRVR